MTSYGTGSTPTPAPVKADGYTYRWINLNYGVSSYPTLTRSTSGGNATVLGPAPTSLKVWDGAGWVSPNYVYDAETATWVVYGQVYDGERWF